MDKKNIKLPDTRIKKHTLITYFISERSETGK